MGGETTTQKSDAGLLSLFESALPEVFDYLLHRAGDRAIAEDLTSETFLAALSSLRRTSDRTVGVGWLIGIARHKLVDHWRREAREDRRVAAVASERAEVSWEGPIESGRATSTLAVLNPSQRAALTLRYVDGLSVPEVAALLGRTVAATENLLVRAKRAFREIYLREGDVSDA